MDYYIDLFSPETYESFTKSNRTVSGFRERQKGIAANLKAGDRFLCYVTRLSRWVGILEICDKYYVDDAPIFAEVDDPFVIRFKVKTLIWLPLENDIPITNDLSWNHLSFTKNLSKGSTAWTGMVRGSLRKMSKADGEYLKSIMSNQAENLVVYPVPKSVEANITKVKTQDSKEVTVSIPENEQQQNNEPPIISQRESTKIQALLATIGERMNLKIWLPKGDRQRVMEVWKPQHQCLLEVLPLNYDNATLKTIENIDVLWIKGRSIVRAFEVEHTTSIYSGILRMADLMALQPNLTIAAHIVAPVERRDKVFQEITRPVFAFLEKGPLSEACTFVSYEAIVELSKEKKLEYMTDAVLEEYAEYAEDVDF